MFYFVWFFYKALKSFRKKCLAWTGISVLKFSLSKTLSDWFLFPSPTWRKMLTYAQQWDVSVWIVKYCLSIINSCILNNYVYRNAARRLTYALAAAFQDYSRRVKEMQTAGTKIYINNNNNISFRLYFIKWYKY